MLRLENLTKRYGSVTALDGVSLTFNPGEMVGIVGRSGAGKSTLLRLVNRLIEPSDGKIFADGEDVTALRGRNLRAWRARSAMIFQQFNLIGRMDVLTNVLVGRLFYRPTLLSLFRVFPAEERAFALAALERLNLAELALQRADTLSGGQQQRVAIARALVQEPRLLLADEPVASLDPVNAERVMTQLRAINREERIAVIVNIHAVDMARAYCDRIVGLADGRLVFDAPAAALDEAALARIYGADGKGEKTQAGARA